MAPIALPRTPAEGMAFFLSRSPSTIRMGLERMEAALAALGHPERRYPILQIAGTNGKGSTCAFASTALHRIGIRVGRYTSPHLTRVNERIWVAGNDIPDEAMGQRVVELMAKLGPDFPDLADLTYFELGTLLALWHFAQELVDVAVLEVGLGGRLDATTATSPQVTAVAPVSLDHTEMLGNTVALVAREKAGIFKPGVPAVVGDQVPEGLQVLLAHAAEVGAPVALQGRDFHWEPLEEGLRFRGKAWRVEAPRLGLRGAHQRQNAALALASLELLARGRWEMSAEGLRDSLAATAWPGRLEQLSSSPALVVDGAHNPAGVEVLVPALEALYPGQKIHLVFGVLSDKDAPRMRASLFPHCASFHLTPLPSPRTSPARDSEPDARALGPPGAAVALFDSAEAALTAARTRARQEGGIVLAAGSLVLVGLAREWARRL